MMILIQSQDKTTIVPLNEKLQVVESNGLFRVIHGETLLGTYSDITNAYYLFDVLSKMPSTAIHKLQKGNKVVGVAPSNVEFIQMPE